MNNNPDTPKPEDTRVTIDPELYAKLEILKAATEMGDVDKATLFNQLGTNEVTIEALVNLSLRGFFEGISEGLSD